MISKLFIINLKALWAGFMMGSRNGKKKPKVRGILLTLLMAYCVVAFTVMFGLLFKQICEPLFAANLGWLYFALIALMSFTLCVFTTIFAVQTLIFGAKDNEMLLSMPIEPTAIVVSRILTLLAYEYLFNLMVAAPALVIWWMSGYAAAYGSALFLIGMLFVPLAALSVSSLLGWAVAAITSRMRNKTIFTLVISFGFLGVYFWLNTRMQSYIALLLSKGEEIGQAIKRAVFPAYHFGIAAAEGNIVSLIIFLLCAVVPFVIVCAVLAKSFIKIATTKRGAEKIKYKERTLRESGAMTALIRIEMKRFFSNAMIIMNAGIGAAFMVAGAVYLALSPAFAAQFAAVIEEAIGISPVLICGGIITGLCSMVTLSSSSISLEGKTLWLVKSLPVSGGDILLAKALTHAIISGGPALLASAVCIIVMRAGLVDALAVVLAPLSMSAAMAFLGVMINLFFPKFDWINEIQPVKQGMSVMICMLGMMVLVMLLVLLYVFALASVMDLSLYLLTCSAVLFCAAALVYFYLIGKGAQRFARLA